MGRYLVGLRWCAGVFTVILAVAGVAFPAAAASGSIVCANEGIGGATINGNVTVPAGDWCTLDHDVVSGNVYAGSGTALYVGNTKISGNLGTEGSAWLVVYADTIGGNVSLDATTAAFTQYTCGGTRYSICAYGNQVNGNVSITNSQNLPVLLASNSFGRNLSCFGNVSGVVNRGYANTVAGHESGQCAGI